MQLSIHELSDWAVNEAALQGSGGVALTDLWKTLGLADEVMRSAVERVLRSREAVDFREEEGTTRVVSRECERLRALGLASREQADDGVAILEAIGKRGRAGCLLTEVEAELRSKKKKEKADYLALERLVFEGLVSKSLRTRLDAGDAKPRRVTANLLRLSRFATGSASDENSEVAEPWKRALAGALETTMKRETGSHTIMRAPVEFDCGWAFADLWKRLKETGVLKRVADLIDGPTPALMSLKPAAASDVCRKVIRTTNAGLVLFLGDVTKTGGRGKPEGREMWCMGRVAQVQGPAKHANHVQGPQTMKPHGLLRHVLAVIERAGTVGGRTNALYSGLGMASAKLIEKAMTALVKNDLVRLRRVTEGRAHAYVSLTPEAFEIYNKWDAAMVAREQTKGAFVDDDDDLVKPERDVRVDFALEDNNNKNDKAEETDDKTKAPPDEDDEDVHNKFWSSRGASRKKSNEQSSFLPNKPIRLAHSAERTRRAAAIVAVVKRHGVVDKAALLLVLFRRGCEGKNGTRVDGKTWRRLVAQLVAEGDLAEARLDTADEAVAVLFDPGLDVPGGPESDAFIDRRQEKRRAEAERKAELEAAHHERKKPSSGFKRKRSFAGDLPPRTGVWDDERRRAFRARFGAVSIAMREDLSDYLETAVKRARLLAARKRRQGARPRTKRTVTTAALPAPKKKKTSSAPSTAPASNRPQPRPPPDIVSGVAVAPLARRIARAVVAARANGTGPCSTDDEAQDVPRASRDAACSRLLRRGWAKHVDDDSRPDERRLELPYQAILDAADHDLTRQLGDADFFKHAHELAADPPTERDFALAPTLKGGTLAVLLAAHARGRLGFVRTDDEAVTAIRRPVAASQTPAGTKELHDQLLQQWRTALGDDIDEVPWISSKACIDDRLRACLRRAVFLALLVAGRATCRGVVDARRKTTPQLDVIETAAVLFDLCDAKVLALDRAPPSAKPPKPTIFDDPPVAIFATPTPPRAGGSSRPPTPPSDTTKKLALEALNDADGLWSPRFFALPDAIDRFLRLENSTPAGGSV